MRPPFTLTNEILRQIAAIAQQIGEVNASFLIKPSPELRKRNRIRTIQASLAVEGNTLSVDQITALLENKRVTGPVKDIREVSNAIEVYEKIHQFHPYSHTSFLAAHKMLMQGLVASPGQFRNTGAGIVKGRLLTHLAPPAHRVPALMKELFSWLKKSDDLLLIKSCVFHYEMEFIHPFTDGNGRMGRLWQTLLLMQQYPVFEFLPFETLISKNQKDYYKALSLSDKQGASTVFIEFMLQMISASLNELLRERTGPVTAADRMQLFLDSGAKEFTRKDYLIFFKSISSATASRDLKEAVDGKLLIKRGDKNRTVYRTVAGR